MIRKKILLVDDSKTALLMEQVMLKKGTYDVITAADGQEAVEKATAERPDLILMDVVMPRLSGIEALKELRRRAPTRATPIIMVTTRGEEPNVEIGFESGCNDYVTKPIDHAVLMEKIRSLLGE